ncbi:hypothetical protein K7640_24770 [Micromonospora sp. PLK6-60]|uniref:hypothetical protein n=1 Tax=Micromonospora sp. PLK6-60 TaxID=2873383 RepID=UPI001CA7079E|nr:hypothetical protein [Micromonospora sp. PLK6-60]MBY8875046.1 hypothetical protein [Micromonospora sp. PLK6-60]
MYASTSGGSVARQVGLFLRVSVDAVAISGTAIGFLALFALVPDPLRMLGGVGVVGGSVLVLRVNDRLRDVVAAPGVPPTPAGPWLVTGWSRRGLACAGALLPAWARDRYLEEWQDGLCEVRQGGRLSRRQRADEVVQCLRAALALAVVLRLRRLLGR